MFFQNGLAVVAMVLSVFFLGYVYHKIVVLPRRMKREADRAREARKAYDTEVARIEALPKLKTRWLMRVPDVLMSTNPVRRSYGTRYNRILVIDESGLVWVGLVTPELIKCLIAGEYIWRDNYIPFRGDGEAYAGDAVTFDGLRIDIYPIWMNEGINLAEWTLWARIERNFDDCSQNWNYHSGLNELNKRMEEFHKKRAEFNILANAVRNQ